MIARHNVTLKYRGVRARSQYTSTSVTLECLCGITAGWFTAAPLLGGYSKDAQSGNTGRAALAAAKSWVVGAPLGLALRTITKGYMPHVSFMIVSMVMTAALMIGWRSGLAAVTPEVKDQAVPNGSSYSVASYLKISGSGV